MYTDLESTRIDYMILLAVITFVIMAAFIYVIFKDINKKDLFVSQLYFRLTKKNRYKKKLKVRLYDERADLYKCPVCNNYLGIDDLECPVCGQRFRKSFWV